MKPDGTGVVEDRWAGAYAPPLADASQGCNSTDIFLSQNRFQDLSPVMFEVLVLKLSQTLSQHWSNFAPKIPSVC